MDLAPEKLHLVLRLEVVVHVCTAHRLYITGVHLSLVIQNVVRPAPPCMAIQPQRERGREI